MQPVASSAIGANATNSLAKTNFASPWHWRVLSRKTPWRWVGVMYRSYLNQILPEELWFTWIGAVMSLPSAILWRAWWVITLAASQHVTRQSSGLLRLVFATSTHPIHLLHSIEFFGILSMLSWKTLRSWRRAWLSSSILKKLDSINLITISGNAYQNLANIHSRFNGRVHILCTLTGFSVSFTLCSCLHCLNRSKIELSFILERRWKCLPTCLDTVFHGIVSPVI